MKRRECDKIEVILHIDGGISVHDNGRGIPVGFIGMKGSLQLN